MAITYGNTVHHWCAGVEATVTNKSDTVCTVTVKTYWHSIAWGYSVYGHGYSVAGGTQGADSGTVVFSSGTGATVDQLIASTTKDITRTTSDQSVTCQGVAIMTGRADANGTSTATVTVTVPKKTSYTVSYNANGGSGAPSSQTKWHGDTLKLSTTKPTRSQYNFLRWNTKADGTGTNYASGANYTANAKVTLYAQWELAYAYPTITNANVIRTDSSNQPQDDGTYAYLTFSWAVDATADAGSNTVDDMFWSVKESSAGSFSAETTVAASGTSGAVAVSIGSGYDVDKTYDVKVSVVDTHGGVYTKYLVLTSAFFTLDFGRAGHSIGIGTTASETADGIDVAESMPIRYDGYPLDFRYFGANPVASTATDTAPTWAALGNGMAWFDAAGVLNGQPSQYGFLASATTGNDVGQLFKTQRDGGLYLRGGNASGGFGPWHPIPHVTVLYASSGTATITLPADKRYLLVSAHNSTANLNGISIVTGSTVYKLAGAGGITYSRSGLTITATSSGNPAYYLIPLE